MLKIFINMKIYENNLFYLQFENNFLRKKDIVLNCLI